MVLTSARARDVLFSDQRVNVCFPLVFQKGYLFLYACQQLVPLRFHSRDQETGLSQTASCSHNSCFDRYLNYMNYHFNNSML